METNRVRNQVRAVLLNPAEERISDQIPIWGEARVIWTLCEDHIWETLKDSLEKYNDTA